MMNWADVPDDSSVESEDNLQLTLGEDQGHVYACPFILGGYCIRTAGDFSYHHARMYPEFAKMAGDNAEEIWADLCSGLLNFDDPEDMDGASWEMIMYTGNQIIENISYGTLEAGMAGMDDPNIAFNTTTMARLENAANDLTLDVFDERAPRSYIVVPRNVHEHERDIILRTSQNLPPMCPVVPDSKLAYIVIVPDNNVVPDLHYRREWSDVISTHVPEFSNDSFDQYVDAPSLATSRSNTRPKGGGVYLEYHNGERVNIGAHGFLNAVEIKFPWLPGKLKSAMSELFSAPGGEGLTCPTPSHILHQIVSACVSASAHDDANATVEENNIDFSLTRNQVLYAFDVTSSAAIWNKSLGPTHKNPQYRRQAAVSKYDLAYALMAETDDVDVRDLLVRAVANCLALEYPKYFRKVEANLPRDLELQSQIYDTLNILPTNTVKKLGKMCYDVALESCLTDVDGMDVNAPGTPWTEKRDRMISKVQQLSCRTMIAVPPLAIGETTPLPHGPFSISIHGHHFQAGEPISQGRGSGPDTHTHDPDAFRRAFPADGRMHEPQAREVARIMHGPGIPAYGLTHKGPVQDLPFQSAHIVELANDIYSSSATAQFAEVNNDIARAVDKLPVPTRNTWKQVYLYKGKVAAWYLVRDNITSSDGFRVDWFAVSSYPVMGSVPITTVEGHDLHLWPRQRFRSQDMKLMRVGTRRLKLTLVSMIEKANATRTDLETIRSAWEKLSSTLISSTYASGKLYITARFLSSTLGSPSSPFDEMAKKLINPRTFADILYLECLLSSLRRWAHKNQYRGTCPLLGLPRAYGQLESYWMSWVTDQFADSDKNFALCVLSLHDEAAYIEETMAARCRDLESQLELLHDNRATSDMLSDSLRTTCALDMNGLLGWSWVGSLASAHALSERSEPGGWDRRFGRGTKARTMVSHMTVRHSARLNRHNRLEKGTVAEMMIDQGTDPFLSTVTATFRFLFVNRPTFFNHPKSGEHKEREISITDPDSRIVLSDAEHICGCYGVTTHVDYLKDSGKNKKFYDKAERVLMYGGGIQSSDATRYGPNMSNFAIAIMLLYLGCYSMHLKWASVVYARMAHRRMLISKSVVPEFQKMSAQAEYVDSAPRALNWVQSLPIAGSDDGCDIAWYCTSHHMGQGMSHHSSSLLHAGGLCVTVDAIRAAEIYYDDVLIKFDVDILVTSDDSTLVVLPYAENTGVPLMRHERQVCARIFLKAVRIAREIGLTMVSVKPNLVKEMISSVKGEFNSQDTGIGEACPIMGFRELMSLIVPPSAPSLVGDYLNAHAVAKDIGLAGQGLLIGSYAQLIMIDMIEERWGINAEERRCLHNCAILPKQLTAGATPTELVSSAASWLSPATRANLYRMAVKHNLEAEDLDPHVRDTIYSPLMHVKVSMRAQHKQAITKIRTLGLKLKKHGMEHQSYMLEESLRATLSSAKSRNLGRIAMRVRNRKVSPDDYLGIKIQNGEMMQTTLDWIKTIESKLINTIPAPSDVAMGNHLAGFVSLTSSGMSAYPQPPRLRRSYPRPRAKPKYRVGDYGSTPFGRHGLKRSGTAVVPKITSAEREAMQEYIAHTRHKRFTEHVVYGRGFVTSWSGFRTSHIVPIDISTDRASQMTEHIRIGSFDRAAIDKLKYLQSLHTHPVLAIHRYDGMTGLWHGIHHGSPYTVHLSIDVDQNEDQGNQGIYHTCEDGRQVILALQGFEPVPNYLTSVPHPDEIAAYQTGQNPNEMPMLVRSVEDQNMIDCRVKSATYTTAIEVKGEKVLVFCAPELHDIPRESGNFSHLEYRRGRVIADLATGGYWNTSLRGVCFRAWLKGHVYRETIWTGGVIGWRLSATSIPSYHTSDTSNTNVKDIIIGTGIDRPEQLSEFNPDFFSKGVKYVSQSNTETYARSFHIGGEFKELLLCANGGQRFHAWNGPSAFMDTMLPAPMSSLTLERHEAIDRITSLYENGQHADAW